MSGAFVVDPGYAPDAETTLYTATNVKHSIVDACKSFSAAGGSLTLCVVPQGGTAGPQWVAYTKTFAPGESYLWPEMAGRRLLPGHFISANAGASNTVNLHISGREFTS